MQSWLYTWKVHVFIYVFMVTKSLPRLCMGTTTKEVSSRCVPPSDVMAADLPKLQVSKRLRQGGQPGTLLWRHPHHQERPRQPLLRRQLQVPGHRDRELRRRLLHCGARIPGNPSRETLLVGWSSKWGSAEESSMMPMIPMWSWRKCS